MILSIFVIHGKYKNGQNCEKLLLKFTKTMTDQFYLKKH